MDDNLRDKFQSDDEYEEFRNSYNDYKNKEGMFAADFAMQNLKMHIKIEELIYKNFTLEKKLYFQLPDEIFGVKNMALYMFYLQSKSDYGVVISMFLN